MQKETKMKKKLLSKALTVVIAVAMVIGIMPTVTLPVAALEATETQNEQSSINGNVVTGTCGDNLTWTLDLDTGILTISGTGAMYDYSYSSSSWYDYRYSIKTVVIENGVTSIGDYAFYWCTSLESITIPGSVTSIGNNVFEMCTSLESITVESGNTKYHSAGNCLIETASKMLIYGCKNSIIPTDGSVTSIGNEAFSWCTSLKSITIPGSVTSIGNEAFRNCTRLEKLVYCGTEEEWNAVTKGDDWNFNVPATVQLHNFDGCVCTECGEVAHTFGDWAEYDDKQHVRSCSACDTVEYEDHSFTDGKCDKCEYVNVITGKCGNDLTWTFSPDTGRLTISGIGTMPDYNTHKMPWLNYCKSIKSIVVEDGVKNIGFGAFGLCVNLTSVSIADSVTNIGGGAFAYCGRLMNITIPKNVDTIGANPFAGCVLLRKITVAEGNTK